MTAARARARLAELEPRERKILTAEMEMYADLEFDEEEVRESIEAALDAAGIDDVFVLGIGCIPELSTLRLMGVCPTFFGVGFDNGGEFDEFEVPYEGDVRRWDKLGEALAADILRRREEDALYEEKDSR